MVSLGQIRSVRDEHLGVDAGAARGARLDLAAPGARVAQLVEQAVDRQRLAVHGGTAVVGGVGEVAVVVPLEVGDVELVEQREQGVAQVVVRPLVLQVEDLLLAPLRRHGGAPAQHPLGVAAGGLGVEVDHLRLDPQAELHAAAGHVVDQRAQALRPDGGVDRPVAEAGGVVAAAEEPAVVEDEALDPDRGGDVGELGDPVEGVVEVDRLPRVGDDRAARCATAA